MNQATTSSVATINLDGLPPCEFSILDGTAGDRAIDVTDFRRRTGLVALDYGYNNTASCKSAITYLDGEKGVLLYRGYPVEELAEKSRFVEVAYLLVNGHMPNATERENWSSLLNRHALLHEDMRHFFSHFPDGAHPMAMLSAMVVSLSTFYPELSQNQHHVGDEAIDKAAARLLSKMRTIAAFSYKKSIGEPVVYPRHDLRYVANFLNMMFSSPVRPYEIKPEVVKALNILFIVHADHEQNCSTSAVRLVGSARVNLYAAVAAGICALWGPLHGGANQMVIEMAEEMAARGLSPKEKIERVKKSRGAELLYGFGHRVYKTYDPRAKIVKKACDDLFRALEVKDPLLDMLRELEERALADDFFKERHLYPNVDFYSGIIYRAIGIPKEMFTVMFALGRLPGWIAHWKEALEDPRFKLQRPRQLYVGPGIRHLSPDEVTRADRAEVRDAR
jgi:citrate synthase